METSPYQELCDKTEISFRCHEGTFIHDLLVESHYRADCMRVEGQISGREFYNFLITLHQYAFERITTLLANPNNTALIEIRTLYTLVRNFRIWILNPDTNVGRSWNPNQTEPNPHFEEFTSRIEALDNIENHELPRAIVCLMIDLAVSNNDSHINLREYHEQLGSLYEYSGTVLCSLNDISEESLSLSTQVIIELISNLCAEIQGKLRELSKRRRQ